MNRLIQLGRETFQFAADTQNAPKSGKKIQRQAHNAKMRKKFGKEWYKDKDLLKKNYDKMGMMKKAGKHLKRPAIRKRLGYGTLGVALTGVGAHYARKKKD
jgi:hypothetical protein